MAVQTNLEEFYDGITMINHELDQLKELTKAAERFGFGTLRGELEIIHNNLADAKQRMRDAFTKEVKRK